MRFFSRLLATTVITFTDSRCAVVKGKVLAWILQDLAGFLVENGVSHAEITIGGNGRACFSKQIPPELHQRLRNILAQI